MAYPRASVDLATARYHSQNGSLEENLNSASDSFKRAKENGSFCEDSVQLLDEAIKQYNFASKKGALSKENKAVVALQLGKAHANRGIATLCFPVANGLQDRHLIMNYHLKSAAEKLKEYREQAQALSLEDAFGKLGKVATDLQTQCGDLNNLSDRVSVAKGMQLHLLGGQAGTYSGPQLPHARLELYIAQQYFHRGLKALDGTMDLAVPLSEIHKLATQATPAWRSTPKEQTILPALRGWLDCLQSVQQSAQSLTTAALHLEREVPESVNKTQLLDAHTELADKVRFCLQRGRVLIHLAACNEEFYRITQGSEEFDTQASLDLCAELRDAEKKAADFTKLGENMEAFKRLTCMGGDIEMECVILHHLALVFDGIGFKTRAREVHKRVVLLALSLDTSADDYSNPTPFLRVRQWFMKSRQYVQNAQEQDRAAEELERDGQLGQIKPQLDAIKVARDQGMKPFLRHVYAHYPPKNGGALKAVVDTALGDVPKSAFLQMLRDYHPDRMPADTEKKERLLFEEISKYFNHFYEATYKV